MQPTPEWGTTDREPEIKHRDHIPTNKAVSEVQSFIEEKIKISFKLTTSDLCTGSSPLVQNTIQLGQVSTEKNIRPP